MPRNDPLAVLPPPPIQASHPLSLKGTAQALRPAPALTAASLHIVLSSGRSWSSPGLMAAAATLSAHPAPCSGQPRGASLQKPELGFQPYSGQQLPGPLSAPESPLRSPSSGLVVCVRASVCVSECGSVRERVAGDPRGPRRREARAGDGSSLWALRCGASSPPGVQLPISRRESESA